MSNTLFSTDAFFAWHEFAGVLAYGLLGGLLLFVLVQWAIARPGASKRWQKGGSLRVALTVGFTLIGVIPPLALGILMAERSAQSRQLNMEDQIEDTATSIAFAINGMVDMHQAGVATAGSSISAIARFDTASLNDSLMRYHSEYPNFLNMLVTDSNGDIVASTSKTSGVLAPVESTGGMNVSDRKYFQEPMTNGYPFVSHAFEGRAPGREPIIALSAIVQDRAGNRAGVVVGSLNVDTFSYIDKQRPNIGGAFVVLIDGASRVIFASKEAGLEFGDSLVADPMVVGAHAARQRNSFSFDAELDGRNVRHMSAFAETRTGWKVFVRVPSYPIAQQMLGDYRVGAVLLLVSCLLSLLLASAVIRRLTRSVIEMNKAIENFSLDGSGEEVVVPSNTLTEFRPIFRAMRRRSRQLERAYKKLSHAEQANRRLSGQNKRDPLTKIANRREFSAFEQRICELAARDQTSVAVIMMDIDLFKVFNDTLGHQAGDDCLRRVAQALEACATRPLDLVARYGGEEFVAVLGGATVTDALTVAERMRKAVLDLEIEHPGSPHETVSISAGTAAMVPTCGQGADDLIKQADEALYYAKAAGRNCVVYREDGEYVTNENPEKSIETTNVIAIISGNRSA